MRCRQCGCSVSREMKVCSRCGGAIALEHQCARTAILSAVEEMLNKHKTLRMVKGEKSDLEIKSLLSDADWGLENKKLEYNAYLLLQDEEKVIVFWEMVRESSSEPGFIAGCATGKIPVGGEGLRYDSDEKVLSYQREYGRIRSAIREIAEQCGWDFRTALFKRRAMYQGVRE